MDPPAVLDVPRHGIGMQPDAVGRGLGLREVEAGEGKASVVPLKQDWLQEMLASLVNCPISEEYTKPRCHAPSKV